ncbi:MAG: amino acid adenylation domain-containing protein [Thermoguttaceae bacterium]
MNTLVSGHSGIRTIRDLVDRMAETRPEATFLVSPETGQELTFKGLQEHVVLFVEQLRGIGLEKGDKVAFLLDNGLFTAQLFLGAMYGGFVSVPLDVCAGPSQLTYTLDHCDAKLVFVSDECRASIHEVLAGVQRPIQLITGGLEGFVGGCEPKSQATRLPAPEPEDVALVIYSTYSIGQPKGAMHCHRSVLAGAGNSLCAHQLSPDDRSLLVLPLYDISAECVTLVPTLMSGGSVVVLQRFNVSQFWDWLDEYRCTWSALAPTIISQLLDGEDPRADSRGAAFRRIRFLCSSSTHLFPSLYRKFLDKFKLPLIQAMGSTEAGNIFSNALQPGKNKIGSSGLPWGFDAKIVDREGVELPPPARPQIIPQRDPSLPCPLSPAQQRLWFLEQLNPGVPVCNEAEAVRLRGELHADALEQALNTIVARHEMLRSTIQVTEKQPVVIVHETWPLRLKKIDLSALAADERQAEVERLLVDEPRRPHNLKAEPGIRATLLRLGPREHVFILMMHHIICDWSSEGVLWRELSVLYGAFSRGEPLALPPLPIQHGDYAAWQQQQIVETDFAEDLSFWEEYLREAPALLELPTDRPRPRVCSYRGSKQRCRLNPDLVKALHDFSRREQTSPFTVFAAAFNTLLYRYTGQEDILVGIPMADRGQPELQCVIGFPLQTHVLRTKLSGNITFRELAARVQRGAAGLYDHRAVPFDQVVNKVQPEHNSGYFPLFQVMLKWRDRDELLSFVGLEGLEVESLLAESRTSKVDLTLTLTDIGEDIWLETEYSTDLFDDRRIERMMWHLRVLLQSALANPDQRIGELPLLTETERHQLLVEWNDTRANYPTEPTLADLFETQAARTPEAVAVVLGGESLTYGELNRRANQLGHYLQKLGVGPDVPVGICMQRSLEMVVGLYGVHKAGGAYVPIDPEYPRQRLARMFDVSRTPVLLMQQHLREVVPDYNGRIVYLDSQWDEIAREPDHAPLRQTRAEHLAYIIFTSGSTGEPKGVMVPHAGICNRLLWMQQAYRLGATDRVLQKTPFSFDVSVWEFFWPLQVGAALVVAKPGGHGDPRYLARLIEEERITTIHFVPSMLRVFLDGMQRGRCRSLRHVLCSGEALPYDLLERFFERVNAELHNLYGPTEASVDVTAWACTPDYPRQVVPIGKPIANTRAYVLDGHQQLVPEGVPGELYLGGIQVARGYLNRPHLTAEKFVPDLFVDQPGARLYKTGDLVRWLSDGNLEFLGRLDHQVKIRGFRIELGEVENCLRRYPAIQDVAVVAREDSPGNSRLVAYIVAQDEEVPSVADLRSDLAQELPEFMVPSAFILLKALPLAPNGKVDRRALPAPDTGRPEMEHAYTAPRTPLEEMLAGIWAEVLGLEQVGIHDNFFDLGGHSLLATQVVSRIRSVFQVELLIRVFFDGPTVAQMAEYVEATRWVAKPAECLANNDIVVI